MKISAFVGSSVKKNLEKKIEKNNIEKKGKKKIKKSKILGDDKKNELIDLGLRVKQIRVSKGLTQMSLASNLGKEHPSINRLEKGKINPSYIYLLEIANGLDVELLTFFQKK